MEAPPSRTIHIGIDDTDMPGTPGTNQLARRLAGALPAGFTFQLALRHQLLVDDRVPYTSGNGSASLLVHAAGGHDAAELLPMLRREMEEWYVDGSDPGLCLAGQVPAAVVDFGRRCQRELVTRAEAERIARASGLVLHGLGGTKGGVIGALAAVGLLASGEDGRVVHAAGWPWPDELAGDRDVAAIRARGVDLVLDVVSGAPVHTGVVDVGKHLRPSYRGRRVVLFVEPDGSGGRGAPRDGARAHDERADGAHAGQRRWRALKLA